MGTQQTLHHLHIALLLTSHSHVQPPPFQHRKAEGTTVTVVDISSFDRRESPAGARAMRVPARLQQRAVALLFLVAFGAAKGSKRGSDGSDDSDFSSLGKRAGGVVFVAVYHKTGTILSYSLRHVIANHSLVQAPFPSMLRACAFQSCLARDGSFQN